MYRRGDRKVNPSSLRINYGIRTNGVRPINNIEIRHTPLDSRYNLHANFSIIVQTTKLINTQVSLLQSLQDYFYGPLNVKLYRVRGFLNLIS